MTTSGSSRFDLEVADLIEDAFDRIGYEIRAGYDALSARRSLNLVLAHLVNRKVPLWTTEFQALPLTAGIAAYDLDPDTNDILPDAALRRAGSDLQCTRFGPDEYLSYPNKTTRGRPVFWMLERKQDLPTITFWPVPDRSDDVFVFRRVRYIQDVLSSNETLDVPRRFLPAIILTLATDLAMKAPNIVPNDRVALLKGFADEALEAALSEDEDRSTFRILPVLSS